MRLSNRRNLALAAAVAVGGAVVLPAAPTEANVGNFDWSNSDQLFGGNYSNVAGFWQAILCGNNSTIALDGIYGNQSKAATLQFKREVLGLTTTNQNVTSSSWAIARTSSYLGFTHLQPSGGGFYSYYAGNSGGAELYWNGNDWKFLQPPANTYIVATTARTMGSTSC